jgi:hypothetical protein
MLFSTRTISAAGERPQMTDPVRFDRECANGRNPRVSPVAAHSGDRLLS